jgi:peptide/nickel transport system substrate-binding protein
MAKEQSYWNRILLGRVGRRRAILATSGAAAAAAFLAACGGGDNNGGDSGGSKDTAAGNLPSKVDDPTKGKQGGKLLWQSYGDAGGGLELIKIRNAGVHQMAGLTHDGLLEFAYGTPSAPGIGTTVQPNAAQALPEISPDKLTVTFKLRPNIKFHNGKALTSADVKWTYETAAFAPESAWKNDFPWIDKVDAPDATTVVFKLKNPNADTLQSFAQKNYGAILNKEHHESGASEKTLMGSGPYLFVDYQPPTVTHYKRNPEYWNKPYPYFETVDRLGLADQEKQIADFTSKQVHVTYWRSAEERERQRQTRPDAYMYKYPQAGGGTMYIRTDKPPFNDKRLRQALSMAIDRKALLQAISNNEGGWETALSPTGEAWQFRKPEQMGPLAKYWNLDLAEAKKLAAAAGVTSPIKIDIPTWNATVIGQKAFDGITLVSTWWRNAGLVDAKLVEENFGQFAPRFTGVYDHMHYGPNVTSTLPDLGVAIRNKYFVPPGGVKAPTLNLNYTDNMALSALAEKQLITTEKEARIAIFRQMEDILAEEQYSIGLTYGTLTYFADPSLRNAQMPRDAYNGATPWMKYWWFA